MRAEKYCNRCKRTLSIDDFSKSSGRYDGVQPYCIECMRRYRTEYYDKNKTSHYARNQLAEAKLRQYLLDIKNESPCVDCGARYPNEPWLMEFDHLPNNDKRMSISQLLKYGSMNSLISEISKCELRCLICHRRKTAERGGWVDNRLAHLLN